MPTRRTTSSSVTTDRRTSVLYSTMQDVSLALTSILRYGTAIHAERTVTHRHGQWLPRDRLSRVGRPGGATRARPGKTGCAPRRARRDFPLEYPGTPGGLLRDPVHGCGAAHIEHPALRRRDRIHRLRRRRPCRDRRHVVGVAAGRHAAADGNRAHRGRGRRRRPQRAASRRQERGALRRSAGRPVDADRSANSAASAAPSPRRKQSSRSRTK